MVISFDLGDSLKEKLLSLGIEKSEAKRIINEFETSLDNGIKEEVKKDVKDEVARSIKDLATKSDIKRLEDKFEQVDKRFEQIDKKFEKIDSKLDKFLYLVLGFMFSLVAGSIFLLVRFGNFN